MKSANEKLKKLEIQIDKSQNKIDKMKKGIPLLIIIGLIFSFAYPYIPGRRGREPIIETYGYLNSVIFSAVLFLALVPVSYYMAKKDLEKKSGKN